MSDPNERLDLSDYPLPFDKFDNCTYTSNGGEQMKMSVEALFELMNSIPETPKILTMPIQMKELSILPSNTILISNDIAEELEKALKGGD